MKRVYETGIYELLKYHTESNGERSHAHLLIDTERHFFFFGFRVDCSPLRRWLLPVCF
jgi:hypothetical protein